MGLPQHQNIIRKNLYNKGKVNVTTEIGEANWFYMGRRLKLGWIFPLYFFCLMHIIRMAGLKDIIIGIKTGSTKINNWQCLDSIILLEVKSVKSKMKSTKY